MDIMPGLLHRPDNGNAVTIKVGVSGLAILKGSVTELSQLAPAPLMSSAGSRPKPF
jgi:hypothetical protein